MMPHKNGNKLTPYHVLQPPQRRGALLQVPVLPDANSPVPRGRSAPVAPTQGWMSGDRTALIGAQEQGWRTHHRLLWREWPDR